MLIASIIALVVLAALVLFQVALIAGAPLGRFAWGGQHKVLPVKLRVGSAVSIVIYAAFATLVLGKSGLWVLVASHTILSIGLWITTAYLALGVLLNAISRSAPERLLMAPVALVLAVCFLVITLG